MDWSSQIDAYCERTDASIWAEPVNAATNIAFVIAALVMWRRTKGEGLPLARALVVILALIGLGSALWHTFAFAWTGALDSGSIAAFILVYLFAANRTFLGWPISGAIAGMCAFVPFAALMTPVFASLPFFSVSAGYWPVPLLIAGYGLSLRHSAPGTAGGLGLGAGLLAVSLICRSLDETLCAVLPTGTHFLWHILNAAMLGWMIEVLRAHVLARRLAGR